MSSDSSSDDEMPSEPIVTVAMGRSRRANAGSKMAALIEKAEQDDFYKQTYGGFDDEAEDEDPDFAEKIVEEDFVDSDFVDSEEDEEAREDQVSDDEEEQKKKKAKIAIPGTTKPRAPPAKKKKKLSETPNQAGGSKSLQPEKRPTPKKLMTPKVPGSPRIRAKRQSTAVKSAEIDKKMKEREKARRRQMENFVAKQKAMAESHREMTQEERLEEAKKTEKANLMSLKRHERLEEDKRKNITRKGFKGRYIKYMSKKVAEPVKDGNVMDVRPPDKYTDINYTEGNIIVFPDDQAFADAFPWLKKKKRRSRKTLCPVTGHPAKYKDPLTKVPYYNLNAFTVIREAYEMALRTKGNRKNPRVAEYLKRLEGNGTDDDSDDSVEAAEERQSVQAVGSS